jgi:4-azaleucine resistance transporter AzlC
MGKSFLRVFRVTVPILLGYVPLGMAFGLMLENAGYNIIWALISSVGVYSGTGQFIEVSFLSQGTALYEVALIIIVLNARMMFYGLSFLEQYARVGAWRWYMMFALTDEVYALLCVKKAPDGVSERDYLLWVSLLCHSYWIFGSLLGVVTGALINFDTTGIDFIMTALFIVLAMEQWRGYTTHEPVFIGLVSAVPMLAIFGPDRFMIPSLILVTALLIIRRKKIEEKLARGKPGPVGGVCDG